MLIIKITREFSFTFTWAVRGASQVTSLCPDNLHFPNFVISQFNKYFCFQEPIRILDTFKDNKVVCFTVKSRFCKDKPTTVLETGNLSGLTMVHLTPIHTGRNADRDIVLDWD